MTESGPGSARHHFDYDEAIMNRHSTDLEAGPLCGTPPKVAFVVCPLVVQQGYAKFDTQPIQCFQDLILVLPSTVVLEGWWERFQAYEVKRKAALAGKVGEGIDEPQGSAED